MFIPNPENGDLRFDLRIIASWIDPESEVLGLGCGDGELLYYLKKNKQIRETGIEMAESRVAECIEKGLSVLQGDINAEVEDYPDNAFDYVILSQTMQQVYDPSGLLRSILRIGKRAVVSFPNFCHWKIRMQLAATGHVPVTKELPYEWSNTPNIRVLSLEDFKKYSRRIGFRVLKEAAISPSTRGKGGRLVKFMPNLFATYGIYMIGKDPT